MIAWGRLKPSKAYLGILLILGLFVLNGCASVPRHSSQRRGIMDRRGHLASRGSAGRFLSGGLSDPSKRIPQDQRGAEAAVRKLKPFLERWQWPLDSVAVTSSFGKRGGDYHEGIDLRAAEGTQVFSVDEGKVIYAGERISGYGKMIVIRHRGGLASVYAHNSRIHVRTGQKVSQGQKIAVSGNTGRSTGPHLHFEVRYGILALDPLKVLPETLKTSAAGPKRRPANARRKPSRRH